DVALSVGMTSVNTLLSPLLTPAIVFFLLRTTVDVDVWSMFLTILQVVVVPIGLGFIIDRYWGKYAGRISRILPTISVVAIAMIVASVVSHNSSRIFETGAVVFVVVILHNLLGYVGGYALGKALGVSVSRKKALAVEIGMQNSGLATSLARTSFPTLEAATVPGAIFSVWHNISGAILAQLLSRVDDEKRENAQKGDRYSSRVKRRKRRVGK
ncbi:MAG: bile acid:sodium symporter family protein, partial [Thermoguttaceae bacterium]|nr:bile acid:sodium symporter family protein [Thermoguttaceae bacterium]